MTIQPTPADARSSELRRSEFNAGWQQDGKAERLITIPRRGRPRRAYPAELNGLDRSDVMQDRLKALALYLDGKYRHQDIATALHRSPNSVRAWIRAWKRGGVENLLSRKVPPPRIPPRFTANAQRALLEAIPKHDWKTARDAWRWLREARGVEVCYLTVWRFLTAKGMFRGETPHSRRFDASAVCQSEGVAFSGAPTPQQPAVAREQTAGSQPSAA